MNPRIRLALLAASPMYYQTPLYQRLATDPALDFTAIFASSGGIRSHDAGYGEAITWDVDLVEGFRSSFLRKAETNPIHGGFLALSDLDVVARLARERYDVLWIHGYNYLTFLLASLAQRAINGRLIFREEQTLLHPRSRLKTAVKEIALRALFWRAHALYIGTENRRWFRHYGVPDERLFFTPYCVDNERLGRAAAELRPKRLELRRKFGIADDSGPVILTVSRLIRKKQPLFLLEAFLRAREHMPCTLLIVGSGELEGAMRAKVEHDRIPDVVFTGFLNQNVVPQAYACADCFALLSLEHETWGLVVNEAMNFSLPVVASDKVGCTTDLVRGRRTGFVVSHTDPAEAADKLALLVGGETLRREMGWAGKELIAEWSYDRAARGVVDAARAAVARRPGAGRGTRNKTANSW
jgi:glycosyltransferase involved in cell wall biosynthesis